MDLANGMEHGIELRDVKKAVEVARAAFAARAASDKMTGELAPGWPAHRQPAIDRAILRLAHYEIQAADVAGAIVINDAVNLAKEFGTEKSAGFVNALLDKILKSKQGEVVTPVTDTVPGGPTPPAAGAASGSGGAGGEA